MIHHGPIAGMGSNLTLSGTVECDTSIMDGHTLQYDAVGAVQGVKNAILVAESLLQTQWPHARGNYPSPAHPPRKVENTMSVKTC